MTARAAKKPHVTLRTGVSVDDSSVGGPYTARFVKAKLGKLKHSRKGVFVAPTGDGIEIHLEEWAREKNDRDVYLNVEIQFGGQSYCLDGPVLSLEHVDALVEMLTAVRDKAREWGMPSDKRDGAAA
ncbi:MAG: hypothetical protein M3P18_03335 [Actinomycetota bacterium]|nr:hypothetical protein [Actinomycetota bacterium]